DFGNSAYALQTSTPRNNCGQVSSADRCLKVTKVGPLSGTVSSNPAGVDCESFCPETSAAFSDGELVTLTAISGFDSLFMGWTGGTCRGTDPCTLTIGSDTSVVATFATRPSVVAAILPSSRSVLVGTPATALATIINTGAITATSCRIEPGATVPGSFL